MHVLSTTTRVPSGDGTPSTSPAGSGVHFPLGTSSKKLDGAEMVVGGRGADVAVGGRGADVAVGDWIGDASWDGRSTNRDGDDRRGDRHRTDQERPATRGAPGLIGKRPLDAMRDVT